MLPKPLNQSENTTLPLATAYTGSPSFAFIKIPFHFIPVSGLFFPNL
jgi:hypothetical protein